MPEYNERHEVFLVEAAIEDINKVDPSLVDEELRQRFVGASPPKELLILADTIGPFRHLDVYERVAAIASILVHKALGYDPDLLLWGDVERLARVVEACGMSDWRNSVDGCERGLAIWWEARRVARES